MDIKFEPLGTDKVVISREDFEDMLDVLAYDNARQDQEEALPFEIASALIDGQNPVRVYRKYRGLSQVALAEQSGVTQAMIARIEGGTVNGSTETLRAIANVLRVSIDDLV